MSEVSIMEWERWTTRFPDIHILQTAQWGQLKESFGWQAVRIVVEPPGAAPLGAQILFRKLPLGLQMAYIARGPVSGEPGLSPDSPLWSTLWQEVDAVCKRRRAVFLLVEPDLVQAEPAQSEPAPPGFQPAAHSIQPPRTIVVNLAGSEDQLLARMKQKTRYNIRLAQKRCVLVQPSDDLDTFYRLMEATADRDAFGVHTQEYYRRAYELFHPHGKCALLMAVYEHQPLAALMVFAQGRRAWYFYGASGDAHRELMPTYLLQWEAMRWARNLGCSHYDLWGVPDADQDVLEAQFAERSDHLWGVYRFKRGFGGHLQRARHPWDRIYSQFWYRLYRIATRLRGGEVA